MNNLLSNAVKYADQLVDITLYTNDKDNMYTVEIRNDGYLIPTDLREKIFEPFYRLKKTEKQKGTGIGLALARSLTELHQGRLYVKENAYVNVFVLSLPVHQELTMNKETVLANKPNLQETNP